MKRLVEVVVAMLVLASLTSCINERDIKEIQQRAAKQAETYGFVDTDRIVDAYFKKFRISAPKGTVLELDESRDICYSAVSGDKKSSVYVVSINADANKKDEDAEYVLKKNSIMSLDTVVFNLGVLKDERSRMGVRISTYDVNEERGAITKTYYSRKYAYILCAFYPKEDSGYVDEVIESFSPTRVRPPVWLTMLLLALSFASWLLWEKNRIWGVPGVLLPLSMFAIYLAPSIIEFSRGYIPFKLILSSFFSIFI